jgi:hypothetical protein
VGTVARQALDCCLSDYTVWAQLIGLLASPGTSRALVAVCATNTAGELKLATVAHAYVRRLMRLHHLLSVLRLHRHSNRNHHGNRQLFHSKAQKLTDTLVTCPIAS